MVSAMRFDLLRKSDNSAMEVEGFDHNAKKVLAEGAEFILKVGILCKTLAKKLSLF